MTTYLDPADQQEGREKKTEELATKGSVHPRKTGTGKKKTYRVLHEDGRFADLPGPGAAGSGALDGTVGRGT